LTLDEELLEKDTLILSAYVKEELYYGVKFIYDPKKDLAVGEQIFNHFYKVCRNRLEGVKNFPTQREKELYLRYVWKNAMDNRVQQDSLSVKRSSVYTVMQNRFFVSEVLVNGLVFIGWLTLVTTNYCECYCIYRLCVGCAMKIKSIC